MIAHEFRSVGTFDADSPLDRQLVELETNAFAAVARVARLATPLLRPTKKQTSSCVAKLDEMVITSGTLPVKLPIASPQNAGRQVGIVVTSGTVTVSATSGQVQGGTSDTLSTPGLYRYESTGVDWWRAP